MLGRFSGAWIYRHFVWIFVRSLCALRCCGLGGIGGRGQQQSASDCEKQHWTQSNATNKNNNNNNDNNDNNNDNDNNNTASALTHYATISIAIAKNIRKKYMNLFMYLIFSLSTLRFTHALSLSRSLRSKTIDNRVIVHNKAVVALWMNVNCCLFVCLTYDFCCDCEVDLHTHSHTHMHACAHSLCLLSLSLSLSLAVVAGGGRYIRVTRGGCGVFRTQCATLGAFSDIQCQGIEIALHTHTHSHAERGRGSGRDRRIYIHVYLFIYLCKYIST